jgi:hypothetical protein
MSHAPSSIEDPTMTIFSPGMVVYLTANITGIESLEEGPGLAGEIVSGGPGAKVHLVALRHLPSEGLGVIVYLSMISTVDDLEKLHGRMVSAGHGMVLYCSANSTWLEGGIEDREGLQGMMVSTALGPVVVYLSADSTPLESRFGVDDGG